MCLQKIPALLFCNNVIMYGNLHILRHGQEKEMQTRLDFPPLVQDVDSSTFEDETFSRPLWRRPNAADGAGMQALFLQLCPLSLQVTTTHF